MSGHPYIDFNGDGHGDAYDSTTIDGYDEYVHHDTHGHIDAVAHDYNHDGRIDEMYVDSDHDGVLDTDLRDTNGDGIMDTSDKIPGGHPTLEHPYVDFNGDGHGDKYTTTAFPDGSQWFVHTDGHGHVDAEAVDYNHDGRVDEMWVDENHDGVMDHRLYDTNGDGILDKKVAV